VEASHPGTVVIRLAGELALATREQLMTAMLPATALTLG